MTLLSKRSTFISAIIAIVLLLGSISTVIWAEYGGHNLKLAVKRYLDANDGDWPQSWGDIEEFHSDPLFGCDSTIFVRQFWGIAWKIDADAILQREDQDQLDDSVPVVYRRSRVENPEIVDKWRFGDVIKGYYTG